MASVIAGMTTSLDGFVADRNGSVDRLYPDLGELHGTPYMDEMIKRTGAVLMGRRAFAPKQDEHLTFTFVTAGIASAVAQAKAAARDKAVQVIGGASVVRQVLRSGLADELSLDFMPVLLGGGLRLFDEDFADVRLEKIDLHQIGVRTSFRFRVRK